MFSLVFLGGIEEELIIETFLEFACIYYPTGKIKKLAEFLRKEGSITTDFQRNIEIILSKRDKTSKKDFNAFVNSNKCMKKIISYCRELFDTEGKEFLKGKAAGCVEKLLYTFDV